MSQELERVYTIPLGKVKISQSQHRAVRAINMIREFARHHMKVETIKIDEELARDMWARGVRNPPRKVRVRMSKTDEGYILVTKYTEDVESKVTPEKGTKKVSDKVEPAKEAPKKEEPAKEAPKKEEPAKEAPKKEEPAKEAPKKEEPAKEAPKKD
ncbi:MAG: 50S ribosomal protein L31e [Candidatus Nitrosopumilus sp. bin_32a]